MDLQVTVPIIGIHRSPLSQKFGIPRQPNLVAVPSIIEMVAPYDTPDAFEVIEAFSHLWITWVANHNKSQRNFKPKVRPPRLGGNAKLGVFATRSTYRPSNLGLSVVKLVKVDTTDNTVTLHITGADMVDGTPIIDIKPYIAYSDSISDAVSGFAPDKPEIKPVQVSEQARAQFDVLLKDTIDQSKNSLSKTSKLQSDSPLYQSHLTSSDLEIICQLIAQDPRPAYRQAELETLFFMRYKQVDVGFKMVVKDVVDAEEGRQMMQIVQVE